MIHAIAVTQDMSSVDGLILEDSFQGKAIILRCFFNVIYLKGTTWERFYGGVGFSCALFCVTST